MTKAPTIRTDPANANRGTQRGDGMLERSLQQYGAGRSVLLDKHGTLIAGNKTAAKAMELGIPIQVVESDGHTLIAVQRTDLDLETDTAAMALGIADNRVGQVSLEWSPDMLQQVFDAGVDANEFWFPEELANLFDVEPNDPAPVDSAGVPPRLITCPSCGESFSPDGV